MAHIREATAADIPQITAIYNQAIRARCTCDLQEVTEEARLAWLQKHDAETPVFVYEQNGQVVGYAYLTKYRDGREALQRVGELSYYVDFAVHKQNIGTALSRHAIEAARALGYTHLIAILLAYNAGSTALLIKNGFTLWGMMPEIAQIDGAAHSHAYYGLSLQA